MFQRKTVPAYRNCDIAIATEQMSDGKWAVVATVKHSTDTAEQTIDLPIPRERFDTQAEAEKHGLQMAKAWIEENSPREVGQPRRN
jgi:hypothetical protein